MSEDRPEHAWHYTTTAGLLGILTSHRVWATSAAYMNDRDEIVAGREALRKAISDHSPALEDWQLDQLTRFGMTNPGNPHSLFLLCASTDGDALTLWRSYGVGSEAEYAIELDPEIELVPVIQRASETHPEPAPPGWYDHDVEYDDQGFPIGHDDPDTPVAWGGEWGIVRYLDPSLRDARDELERVLAQLKPKPVGDRSLPFILDYIAGPDPTVNFKHSGFQDEEEVRATWWLTPWWRFVLYRAGRFGVTPYIEVGAPLTSAGPSATFFGLQPNEVGPLPIRTIRIGPTRGEIYAERTLRELLNVTGYGHVTIETSSTPYR